MGGMNGFIGFLHADGNVKGYLNELGKSSSLLQGRRILVYR